MCGLEFPKLSHEKKNEKKRGIWREAVVEPSIPLKPDRLQGFCFEKIWRLVRFF